MKKTKILVTGGAGFVGSNLCERLSKQSNLEIYSLDNYLMGSESNHVDGVIYLKGDASKINELVTFKPDLVYHLGEYSRVEQSFDDIELVWRMNKDGIFSVLEFVKNNGSKIVYAGSSTKFGDGGSGRNSSPYAWIKASNSELVKNYASWFGIPYAITYFYNVYGKREISNGKYATLIASFANKMKKNEPLTIVSPGSQVRNFTHIDDIIDALVLVGECGEGDEYGIGSNEAFSILEVAALFGGEIEMLPSRKGNRMTAEVLTSKTEALGWTPKRHLAEYIQALRENKFQN